MPPRPPTSEQESGSARAPGFGAHLNLTATIGAAFGVVVGAVGLLASLAGADVFIRLPPLLRVDGLGAGVLGLLVMPVAFALVGVLLGLLTYLPFRALMRLPSLLGARRSRGD